MKALVIAPQPFFTPRGTPFSVYYRTLIMAELGTEVDLLTYGQGDDVDIPGVRLIRIPAFRFLGRVRTGPSLLKLFLDSFVFIWGLGLLIRHRYDFVHAHEESVFFCRFLKPVFGFQLVYDMHSNLPQQLTSFNFTRSRLIHGIFGFLEKSALRSADAVITICPDLRDFVNNMDGISAKHRLIENSIFEPVRLTETAKHTGSSNSVPTLPSDRQLVLYAGTLEPYQGIDALLEAMPSTITHHPDAYFVIIGGQPQQVEYYRRKVEESGVADSCMLTGRLTQQATNQCLEQAAIVLSPRSEGANTPLKIYQQLAGGVPLVATNIYSHTQVLTDEVAFLCDPSPEGLVRGILAALTDPQEAHKRASAARCLYEQQYSRDIYVGKMREILESLKEPAKCAELPE